MIERVEKAILAGGCFWGMQDLYRRRPGVITTRVGYSGGEVPHATSWTRPSPSYSVSSASRSSSATSCMSATSPRSHSSVSCSAAVSWHRLLATASINPI